MRNMNKLKVSLATMAAFSSVLVASDASATIYTSCTIPSSATIVLNAAPLALMGTPTVVPTFTCANVVPAIGSNPTTGRCLYIDKVLTDGQFTYNSPDVNFGCDGTYTNHAAYSPLKKLCNDSPRLGSNTYQQEAAHGSIRAVTPAAPAWTAPGSAGVITTVHPATCTGGYQALNAPTAINHTSGSTTVAVGTTVGLAGVYKMRTDVPNSGSFTNRGGSIRLGRLYLYKKLANSWEVRMKAATPVTNVDSILFAFTATEVVLNPSSTVVGSRTLTIPNSNIKFSVATGTNPQSFGLYINNSTNSNIKPTTAQLANIVGQIKSTSVKF